MIPPIHTKENMTRFRFTFAAACSIALALVACKSPITSAQTASASSGYGEVAGVGAHFGSHNPRTCPQGSLSGGNAPTVKQATMSVVCNLEGPSVNNTLILISDVTVQIGQGRSYTESNLYNVTDADVHAQVYPIRGSLNRYICSPLPPAGIWPAGQQCSMFPGANAAGACYKNTFGEWHCTMAGGLASQGKNKLPPPTTP